MQSNSTPVRSSTDSSNVVPRRADMAAAAAFMMSSFNNHRRSCMRVYRCAYCTRTFHSSQALGGHQNAHRRDRIVAREKFVQERIAFMTKQINSFPPLLTTFPQPNPNPNFHEHHQITPPPPPPPVDVARSGPTYFDSAALGFQPAGLATGSYVPSSSPLVGFQSNGLLGYEPQNDQLGLFEEMCRLNPGPDPSRAAYNFPNDQPCLLETYDYNPYYYLNNNAYEMNSAKKMKMEGPWEMGMEASSTNTAESHTNDPKAENYGGDQDRKNEVTSSSKKRAFIDLTYSP